MSCGSGTWCLCLHSACLVVGGYVGGVCWVFWWCVVGMLLQHVLRATHPHNNPHMTIHTPIHTTSHTPIHTYQSTQMWRHIFWHMITAMLSQQVIVAAIVGLKRCYAGAVMMIAPGIATIIFATVVERRFAKATVCAVGVDVVGVCVGWLCWVVVLGRAEQHDTLCVHLKIGHLKRRIVHSTVIVLHLTPIAPLFHTCSSIAYTGQPVIARCSRHRRCG